MKQFNNISFKSITLLLCALIVTVIVFQSCKKNEAAPVNPFDGINYGSSTTNDTVNPQSFVGLHKKIFTTKCAMPGCHDGNFEPDFRTVQSSYTTLVYHPVVKKLNPWVYRVTPYDTAKSWFWQRINHQKIISGTDTSEGRMTLYSSKLSATELNNISAWILNGARDMFGQLPVLPNAEPIATGYISFNPTYTVRYDTVRLGGLFYNPFQAPKTSVMNILVGAYDDITPVSAFTNNKLKISKKPDDFSSAQTYNGTYLSITPYELWVFPVNTSAWSVGDTLYMRYYTNDGDHTSDTEFPRNDVITPYKTYWSFVIVP